MLKRQTDIRNHASWHEKNEACATPRRQTTVRDNVLCQSAKRQHVGVSFFGKRARSISGTTCIALGIILHAGSIGFCNVFHHRIGVAVTAVPTAKDGLSRAYLISQPSKRGHPSPSRSSHKASRSSGDEEPLSVGTQDSNQLEAALMKIWLFVFLQSLSEGIAISSVPLYVMRFGATPVQVGLITSCFSLAQMLCCPSMVALSSRVGRTLILRVCLAGAACSSFIVAMSSTVAGVIVGRCLAGVFAACIPVAQSAVTDMAPADRAPIVLSRVTAASQLGIVIGPALSAVLQEIFGMLGVATRYQVPAAFASFGLFSMAILSWTMLVGRSATQRASVEAPDGREPTKLDNDNQPGRFLSSSAVTQLLLRIISGTVSWALVLSVSTYAMFTSNLMGYSQRQLSVTLSFGAAMSLITQIFVFPRVVKRLGPHSCCGLGLLGIGFGLGGYASCRTQPMHAALYALNRVGAGVADTSTATLVSLTSASADSRARNLAFLQSSRAFGRLFTPMLGGYLLQISLQNAFAPGAIPYFTAGILALMLIPVPFILKARSNTVQELSTPQK